MEKQKNKTHKQNKNFVNENIHAYQDFESTFKKRDTFTSHDRLKKDV